MVLDRGSSNEDKGHNNNPVGSGGRLSRQNLGGSTIFQNRLSLNPNRATGRFSRGPLSLPSSMTAGSDYSEFQDGFEQPREQPRSSTAPSTSLAKGSDSGMHIPLLSIEGGSKSPRFDSETFPEDDSSIDPSPSSPFSFLRCLWCAKKNVYLERSLVFRDHSDHPNYRGTFDSLITGQSTHHNHHHHHASTQVSSVPSLHARVEPEKKYPPNVVRNQKYSALTFIPLFLYNEFRFFFNLYFLVVALTQMFPVLQVGFLFTYVAPLAMVLAVSMIKEILDDLHRARRDAVANSEAYSLLLADGTERPVISRDIKVGDVLVLRQDQRVPCDCVLLRTNDTSGTVFIRTDQLDGETDWKLRRAIPLCQQLSSDQQLFALDAQMQVEAPRKEIYEFLGTFTSYGGSAMESLLSPPTPAQVSSSSSSSSNFVNHEVLGGSQQQILDHKIAQTLADTNTDTDTGTSVSENTNLDSHLSLNMNSSIQYDKNVSAPTASPVRVDSLSLENTLWGNTVLATGVAIVSVVYTGNETRSVLNTSTPSSKVGLVDEEINFLAKVLFVLTLAMASMMTAFNGTHAGWAIYLFRMVLLFSSIIPVSLRVNLDMGKMVYAALIERDTEIPETIVRTTTISEELGRIQYVFTDKTGTLTRNEMVFKTLQLSPPVCFTSENTSLIKHCLQDSFQKDKKDTIDTKKERNRVSAFQSPISSSSHDSNLLTNEDVDVDVEENGRDTNNDDKENETLPIVDFNTPNTHLSEKDVETLRQFEGQGAPLSYVTSLTRDALTAIALCHNVTPVYKEVSQSHEETDRIDHTDLTDHSKFQIPPREFQAASPDEVALVTFADEMGLHLTSRTTNLIELTTAFGTLEKYSVLQTFPFTSESKRMGIVVRDDRSGKITFFVKGAESVMIPKVIAAAWLEEEVANLARVGLRTLVFAKKQFSEIEYQKFETALIAARSLLAGRDVALNAAIEAAEYQMTLIGLTGVEDRLQDNVRSSLETLRNAGVAVWMLTGDKAETAACIATSAKLIDRGQSLFVLSCTNRMQAGETLGRLSDQPPGTPILVEGSSLKILMDYFPREFAELACRAPAVVCSRCSPTQKAEVVELARLHSGKRTLAIGDGGNDVAMIQAADVGIGIVGKEGKQAANAADFSITQFSFLVRLMLWHGRNSYKRSANLALFIMHRGLIISIIQCVFSALFFFVAVPIYTGWLTVGYTTVFTMLPVFAQVLDEDVSEATVALFPEIYSDAQRRNFLSVKTFALWFFLSVYQGGLIIVLAMILFEDSFVNIVGISFTALIVCELVNIALTVVRWRAIMIWSQIFSIIAYLIAMFTLRSYFDITFLFSSSFAWKAAVITAAVTLPPALARWVYFKINPPVHTKIDSTRT